MPKYNIPPGLQNVGSYQVSGKPFASGSITTAGSTARCIKFPYLTRWIIVTNHGTDQVLRVGFSEGGVQSADAIDGNAGESGNYYFRIPPKISSGDDKQMMMSSQRLELKVSEIWIKGSNNVDVIAGLTNIPSTAVATSTGRNWSGSVGVG